MAIPAETAAADRSFGGAVAAPPHARSRARALLFGSGVLFGLAAVLTRLATLAGMAGGQVTLVRFALGLAFVCGIFAARPGTFRPRRKWLLATRGAFGGIAALLYYLAIARIPAGEATLLNNTFPIFAVLVSFVALNERPTLHLAVALALATAGVFLVVGGGQLTFRLGAGEVLGIASGITGGVAVAAIRALRATENAPSIFFSFSVGGLLVSIPFAVGPWPHGWLPYLVTAGVGVVAFLAQIFMTEAYGALSVPEAAVWQQLTPIASYLWALTVGETLGAATVVGVLLGVAGIAYGAVLGHAPRDATAPEARMAEGIPAEEP